MSKEKRPKPFSTSRVDGLDPRLIPLFKKQRFLLTFSEDDFRDQVVRPLMLRRGFTDGRDLCGPDEEGKDAVFLSQDRLGQTEVWAVQTKKGKLNLASTIGDNLTTAVTQLRTALDTSITLTPSRQRLFPAKVVLCASGTINKNAREHIYAQVQDPRILFLDATDLISQIDSALPELWWGIDSSRFPYLRGLKTAITKSSDAIALRELGVDSASSVPITDELYVNLQAYRLTTTPRKIHGRMERVPKLEEFPLASITRRRESRLLLLGDAGDGKTTALRRIAFVLCQKALEDDKGKSPIPVLLKATDLMDPDTPLTSHVFRATADLSETRTPALSDRDLREGLAVILVDALDELATEERRLQVLSKLSEFTTTYPECKLVLTTRPYQAIMSLQPIDPYEKFRISPIDFKQVRKLVSNLTSRRSLPSQAANELMRKLQDVHGLQLNPLLVTVFAATSDHHRRDIPANITELFKKFTELMLGRWDQGKGLAQQYQAPLKDFLLRRVAFEMHNRRRTSVSIDDFRVLIGEELHARGHEADIDELTDELVSRSGLLRVDGHDLSFRHVLLQEFFAGRAIPHKGFVMTVVTEEWWRRAIVFYFGEHPDNETALGELVGAVSSLRGAKAFTAAVTLGLAIQACYLAKVDAKADALEGVIAALARTVRESASEGESRYPLHEFVGCCMFGRDAVAVAALGSEAFQKQKVPKWKDEDGAEAKMFWNIVGLLEIGEVETALEYTKKFKPEDSRLLLGIHLGAFLVSNLRISTDEQRHGADKICARVADHIAPLIKQVRDELCGMLLEVRNGAIVAVDAAVTSGKAAAKERPETPEVDR